MQKESRTRETILSPSRRAVDRHGGMADLQPGLEAELREALLVAALEEVEREVEALMCELGRFSSLP